MEKSLYVKWLYGNNPHRTLQLQLVYVCCTIQHQSQNDKSRCGFTSNPQTAGQAQSTSQRRKLIHRLSNRVEAATWQLLERWVFTCTIVALRAFRHKAVAKPCPRQTEAHTKAKQLDVDCCRSINEETKPRLIKHSQLQLREPQATHCRLAYTQWAHGFQPLVDLRSKSKRCSI